MTKQEFYSQLARAMIDDRQKLRLDVAWYGYGQFSRPAVLLRGSNFGWHLQQIVIHKATTSRNGVVNSAEGWKRAVKAKVKYDAWLAEWKLALLEQAAVEKMGVLDPNRGGVT